MASREVMSQGSEEEVEGKKEPATADRLSSDDVPRKALSTEPPSVFGFLAACVA